MLFDNGFLKSYGFWHWGEGFQTILLTWYLTFHLGLSEQKIGFFQAASLIPFLIMAVPAGRVSDRYGPGPTFSTSALLFSGVLIGYAIFDHLVGYNDAAVLTFCILAGGVSAFANPAIDTFIPHSGSGTPQSNSMHAAKFHFAAKVLGNLTGFALPYLHPTIFFIFNSSLFFASVQFMKSFVDENVVQMERKIPSAVFSEVDTWSLICSHFKNSPQSFDTLLVSFTIGLFAVPAGYVSLPLMVRTYFPNSIELFPAVIILYWLGGILAIYLSRRIVLIKRNPGKVLIYILAVYSVMQSLLLTVDSFVGLCVISVCLGVIMVGKPLIYGNFIAAIPYDIRATVLSIDQTIYWGSGTVGTIAMGVSIHSFGLSAALIVFSVGMAASTTLLYVRNNITAIKEH